MGLDITAGKNAKFVRAYQNDDLSLGYHHVYATKDFPDQADGLQEGWYSVEDEHSFRAGSYGGYNQWREELSCRFLDASPELVWSDPVRFQDKPFFELINFSDAEGTIGPRTSAKLYEDFKAHIPSESDDPSDNYFLNKYKQWMRAFELAAQNGFVKFH